MMRTIGCVAIAVLTFGAGVPRAAGADATIVPTAIVCSPDVPFAERLAAQEIRRYLYVRTGQLLPIVGSPDAHREGSLIVVGTKSRPVVAAAAADPSAENSGKKAVMKAVQSLAAEQYLITTVHPGGRPVLLVAGGDPTGTLYGAYRLAERLGVRFYLHGDVIPDRQIPLAVPGKEEVGKPLFDRRGIQPFHDFPEGPDWWNADGYKAILGQLAKLRMNFFGLHTYPEGGVGPEPLTWIGRPGDFAAGGLVKASYPSRHFTTVNGTWGYRAMKTGDYTHGAAAIFDRDDYGVDYMRGMSPWPKTPEDQNELFSRMGGLLRESFTFARQLGIKTCIGTETPLTIPTPVKQRLKKAGKNPADPAVVQEIYEGMFRRIAQTHPLDYYWFWTPEGWTWEAVKQPQIDATLADLRAAIAAAKKAEAPFTLATCGWVLGPPQQPALFDNFLPKDMPMSCISRQVGQEPVEPGFAKVAGRPKWAIPWMEDDPALTSVQLWVGRMRKDAADALAYGCTGLMGIHWRTRVLGPNVSALAAAAWDQSAFNPAMGAAAAPPKEPEGPLGGQFAAFPGAAIAGTDDPALYQTVRYNTGGYRLDVPNGNYTVTLKFCEPHYAEAGKRVFGAKLQGKQVIDGLDIFAKVGKNRALDYTFKDVRVSDGRLAIDFVYQVEFPSIAAIAVEGPVARKINCGGPAHKDFQADWPPSTTGGRNRYLASADFWADWARAEFGPEVAKEAAAIFTKIDCHMPRPTDWVTGPGSIRPDPRPWRTVEKEYAFVDQFSQLDLRVRGAGNIERFGDWLNTFHYMRAAAKTRCTWHRFNEAMAKAKAEKDPAKQKDLARRLVLPLRRELVVGELMPLYYYLLATVTTPGEMGTVANWQQQIMPLLVYQPGEELAKLLGEPLPWDVMPQREYPGRPRMFVPTVRTALVAGERLTLPVIVLGSRATEGAVYWRPLGPGQFARVPLVHVARGVYTVTLPAEATKTDLEYYVYVEASGAEDAKLRFPPTAPVLNQSVVVVEGK